MPRQHLRAHLRRLAARAGLTAQPMHQPRVAGGPIPSPHPLGLPVAQPQHGGRAHQVEFARLYSRHNDGTTPFFRTHD